MKERLKVLDFLRGIAILLVMFRHAKVSTITTRMGWIGVDLFFVLSGFLVSGLLFSEYKKTKKIRPTHFLIRRGFKIYPLFYITLLFHIFYFYIKKNPFQWNEVLPEIFFYQNYSPGIIGISWSLAIEEHFYILLCIGTLILSKSGTFDSKKLIPYILIFICVFCLALRITIPIRNIEFDSYKHFFPTHLRIDSLAFGVLISWAYHFSKNWLTWFIYNNKILLILLTPIMFIPAFIFEPESAFIITAGFTLLYIGFGILLVLMLIYSDHISARLKNSMLLNIFFIVIAWIGIYSYSIYLIHMKAGPIISNYIRTHIINITSTTAVTILTIFINIIAGYTLSLIIEQPFLKLREKYFPASSVNAYN